MSEINVVQSVVSQFVAECHNKESTLQHSSDHQLAVGAFCSICAEHSPMQSVSHVLTNQMTKEQAVLRATLQLEEIFELIRGLGVSVRLKDTTDADDDITQGTDLLEFKAEGTVNLAEIIDGLVDDSVISAGTASLLGIPLAAFEEVIDTNNLQKFSEGHYFREDGKLVKPEGHPKPDLDAVVRSITKKQGEEKGLAAFTPYTWPQS
jgi:predicted HAD superfamily Cof-like phosphohydrolase